MTVYCSKEVYPEKNSVKEWNKAKLVYLPFSANGVQSIIYDIVSIIHALFYADVLLILGVSGCVLVPFIKMFTKKNIVVHIDGLEWKRNKWARPIQKFLKFSERLAVKYSDADVADNEAIKQYTAQEYGSLSYQIEYGADHVMKVIPDLADLKKYPLLKNDYAFNVCRIEPENNVAIILEAFSKTTSLPLVMVGNWNKSEYGVNLKAKYAKYGHIHLLDAIYNQRELDVLRSNCMLYLHGHSAGGTNPSLVEAMYLRLPILAFNVAYNVSTTEGKALYFDNAEDIVHKLDNLKSLSLPRIAVIMEEIAVRRYRWPVIASKYAQLVNAFDYKYVKAKTNTILKTLDGSELYHNEVSHLNQSKPFYETI